MIAGNHQFGIGAQRGVLGLRCRGRTSGRPAPTPSTAASRGSGWRTSCSAVRSRFIQSAPNTLDMQQKYFGSYAQDTWKLSTNDDAELRVRWEPWFPQQHRQRRDLQLLVGPLQGRARSSTVFPQAPPGFTYPGDAGFPNGKAGMSPSGRTSRRASASPGIRPGDGRMSVRAGYGMNSEFVNGQFFINTAERAALGFGDPPDAAEYRPVREPVRRHRRAESVPDHVRRERAVLAERAVPGAAVGPVDHDARPLLERQRPAAVRRQHGGVGELHRQLHDQPVGRRDRQPGHRFPAAARRPARARSTR